jgi:hypothetical protein
MLGGSPPGRKDETTPAPSFSPGLSFDSFAPHARLTRISPELLTFRLLSVVYLAAP